ncbi:hypothetical protein [Rhodanobacter denitrificans]|uniref:hypothetical protein n=1 Tax=Rhodanobacter denitrificans TaxID=666685 RepID=UPI001F31C7FB|nr:hypothetical protein [Rhodanobacter denitrificans]UJJ60640.1 hypothetical protein LRK55_19590 [Rhodanobacter denitrificans]
MPDFERLTRGLELHLAKEDPTRLAYLRGRNHGLDKARRQASWLALVVAMIVAGVVVVGR